MNFKKELEFLLKYENVNEKYKLTNEEINTIKYKYPNVPDDYIYFLQEIGAGTIREMQFMVTDTLFDFKSIKLDEIYDLPESVKLFGDDYSGNFAGFDLSKNKDEVVEFWHDSNELYYTGKTFREYIREQMLMDKDGSDMRE